MLILNSHNIIVIKPSKVAGSTLESMFARHCSPHDIVSAKECQPYWPHPVNDISRAVKPHMKAKEIARRFPRQWSCYQRIAVVRNPLDYAISLWWWKKHKGRGPGNFARWIRRGKYNNAPFYFLNDEMILTRIIRYENFAEDVLALFNDLELDPGEIPRIHTGIRPTDESTMSYYTPELLRIMAKRHQRECEAFGYQIPQSVC